jgi:hypothetical protein
MDIKTILLSHLTADPQATLLECADSGQPVVVELPDHRLVALQPLDQDDRDHLTDELLASNTAFQALLAKSKASPRKPFAPASAP